MTEDLKALVYALHDVYGYHPDEEDKGKEILHLLNKRRWFLVSGGELDDMQERISQLEFAEPRMGGSFP